VRIALSLLLVFMIAGAKDIYEDDLTADEAAANRLAKNGITAYNLEDGFIYGWQEEKMPWDGQ